MLWSVDAVLLFLPHNNETTNLSLRWPSYCWSHCGGDSCSVRYNLPVYVGRLVKLSEETVAGTKIPGSVSSDSLTSRPTRSSSQCSFTSTDTVRTISDSGGKNRGVGGRGRRWGVQRLGKREREIRYLSLHCHHESDSESHYFLKFH